MQYIMIAAYKELGSVYEVLMPVAKYKYYSSIWQIGVA